MDFGSRISESKDYMSVGLRENYNSNSISSKYSTPTQIVDELRKKYDTPTRRDKDMPTKSLLDRSQIHQDLQLKKSITSAVPLGQATNRLNHAAKNYELSPMYKKENVGEEETIFRKIKQMKDSLLNKNEKVKTTKSIYQPRMSEKVEPRLNDNRVENIDKINSKIQQILSCLKENQGRTSTYEPNESKVELKGNSKVTVDNSTKSYLSRTSQIHENKPSQQDLKNLDIKMQVKNTSSIYQEDRKYKIESPAPKKIDSFEISSNRDNSKVRSFINSIQREAGVNSKYEMRSGKKLDDEINKIDAKIQQFQDEKRKLNIQFKPYSYSNSKSTANLTKRSYTIDKGHKPYSKLEPAKPAEYTKKNQDSTYTRKTGGYEKYSDKNYEERYAARTTFQPPLKQKNLDASPIQIQLAKKYQKYERPVANEKQHQKQQVSMFKLKLMAVENESKTINSRVENRLLSDDFRKKTDEGILDRKKKLTSQSLNRSRPHIKKMVEKLSQQANLDQKLRNNKLYFESNMESNKWQTLDEQLKKNGMRLDRQKLYKVFKVTDQENNPFFSVRESQSNIETLAKSYIESEQHWSREIFKALRREQLANQQFSAGLLDLEKKGYLVVEDIVRFLNMETGTFYRNRDLFLIFRRISQQQKITFDQLMSTFCK